MSGDTLEINPEGMRKIIEHGERVQSEMCSMHHPFWGVLCMKRIGHAGQHWFMARWRDSREVATDVRAALREIIES